ncbi:hypothetical protein DIDNDMLP_00527 [Klebsiella phage KP13-7]|nr:hypothetical protein DIDNDMLP_00527 [Klebsiella phage KP13-7]
MAFNLSNLVKQAQTFADDVEQAKTASSSTTSSVSNSTSTTTSESSATKDISSILQNKVNSFKNDVSAISNNKFAANPQPENNGTDRPLDGVFYGKDFNDYVVNYENVLLQYDNYTWHFSLYALSPDDFKMFNKEPNWESQEYIIAESGVTSNYSITDVKITNAVPASPGLTTCYSSNTYEISVTENNSMSLYDTLIVLSNKLGYKKFGDVPLILELKFIGYKDGAPTVIPDITRKWSVRMIKVLAQASQTGSVMKYNMQLVANTRSLVDNNSWTLKEQYNCTAAYFDELCADLEDKLNEMSMRQYGYLVPLFSELSDQKFFELRVTPSLKDLYINYDSKQSSEVGKTSTGQQGSKYLSWNASTPVSRIIDDVLDNCGNPADVQSVRQFVNIIPVQEYVGFDPYRNTTVYKVIFNILPYKLGDIVHEKDLEKERFNFETFFNEAKKYIDPSDNKTKIKAKTYNYHFTGLNQEILNLDLKFDQQFFVATTRNPTPIQDTKNIGGTHASTPFILDGVQYKTLPDAWEVAYDLKTKEKLGTVLTDEQKQFVKKVNESLIPLQKVGAQEEQDELNNFKVQVNREYVEDYNDNVSSEHSGTGSDTGNITTRDNLIYAVPTEAENNYTTTSASVNDNSSSEEMIRRNMRDNYYVRPFLMNLDMKVVGDPYWLGWSDYSFLKYIKQIVQDGQEISLDVDDFYYANYLDTEAYLLLNIKPVVSINDNTGILDVSTPTIFNSSFYRVNKVVSTFSNGGSFTQQLQAALVVRALKRSDSTSNSNSDTN